jgi:hypothetical protein
MAGPYYGWVFWGSTGSLVLSAVAKMSCTDLDRCNDIIQRMSALAIDTSFAEVAVPVPPLTFAKSPLVSALGLSFRFLDVVVVDFIRTS